VGVVDPLRKGGGFIEGSIANWRLAHHESVRIHLLATAERIEQELGRERQLNEYEGSEEDWEQQPVPDGPITVGIDGGYVRAAHKQGCLK